VTSSGTHHAGRVPSLDMIRGVAILLVVLVHSGQMIAFPGFLADVTSLGRYGVPLFFILSGFLMGSLYGHDAPWSLRNFVSRRAGRLLPAWWTFLALWLLAFALFPEEPFALAGFSAEAKSAWILAGIVLSVILLNDLTPVTTNLFVPGGWSISAEAMHYALFPRIRQLSGRSIATIALVTAGGSVAAWIWIAWAQTGWTPLNAWLTTWAPWATLPLFLTGLLLARGLPGQVSLMRRLILATISVVSAALSAWLANLVGVDLLPLVALAGASLFASLYYAARVPKWLVLIGGISYEMYFTHFVVLAALERSPLLTLFQTPWGGLPFFVTIVLVSALVAALVRWSISRPGARLIQQTFTGAHA